jgi:DNA polymerase-3 subunit beta
MKLTIKRAAFLNLLRTVKPATDRKGTMPILSHVLLTAAPATGLVVVGTDLGVRLTATTRDFVLDAPGAVCLPADKLTEIVSGLPDGDVGFAVTDGKAKITAGKVSFTLRVAPADDYPRHTPADDAGLKLSLPAKTLRESLSAVRHAVSTDDTRYHLNGINLELSDGKLTASATDGHRLATVTCDAPTVAAPSVLLPAKAIGVLLRLLPADDDAQIDLSITRRELVLVVGDVEFSAKFIDAQFPDYRQVIPAKLPHILRVDSAAASAAVKRVGLCAGDRRGITISGGFVVAADDVDAGEANETIDADGTLPAPIGLNGQYLADALTAVGDGTVEICAGDPETPIVVRGLGGAGVVCVVMPMRL